MIGGLMKNSSRLAALTAAGLFSAGVAMTSASAADLGGDCCADLEERVAELEATTVRKGNTKVSLKLSGQINQTLLWWDDGDESDVFVGDNNVSGSRLKFGGSGKINSDWEAGFYMELDYRQSRTANQRQDVSDGGSLLTGDGVDASDLLWYLKSKTLGKLSVGKYDAANDGILCISLGGTSATEDCGFDDWINDFAIRRSSGALSGTRWDGIFTGEVGEGSEIPQVRYDSPTIAGFTLSASWGENDYWAIALRYAGEWAALGGLRVAGGIGFGNEEANNVAPGPNSECGGRDCDQIGGSISVLHVPTGLFVTFAAGQDDIDASGVDENTIYVQGGINKKVFAAGATRIYGVYYHSEDKLVSAATGDDLDADALVNASFGATGIQGWGVGIVQAIDSAAIELYAAYRHYEVDQVDVFDAGGNRLAADSFQDMDAFVTGARIKF